MELRHLRTFVAAAEEESFTRAAESLGLTQAAISQHVAALEKDLQVKLFERVHRSIAITEAGRRFYEYARKILDLIEEARQDLGQQAGHVSGTLRVAASSVPAESLLPELLTSFRERHPSVHVAVEVSDSDAAAAAVAEGQADVGLVGDPPRARDLTASPVADDELVLVAAARHPISKRRRLTLKQLRGQPVIVREAGSGSRRCVEQALEHAGLDVADLTVAMEMNSNEAIRAAVSQGAGVAFQSRAAVAGDVAAGRIVAIPVEGVKPRRKLFVIHSRTRIPNAPLRAFLECIETLGKEGPSKTGRQPK